MRYRRATSPRRRRSHPQVKFRCRWWRAPAVASLYRLDQLIATAAQRTLWLTDAYFVGVAPYVQALRAAAMDGVDVRLLVPGSSDIPWLVRITRAGYRPLLEAGVRIFEWNGPMMHAKTAVADCRWARVGSSNLNIASWMGNYELDVAVDDPKFAQADGGDVPAGPENATEIVLNRRNRVRPSEHHRRALDAHESRRQREPRSSQRTAHRQHGKRRADQPARARAGRGWCDGQDRRGAAALASPASHGRGFVAVPVGVIAGWIGLALVARAYRLRAKHDSDADEGERELPEPIDQTAADAHRAHKP